MYLKNPDFLSKQWGAPQLSFISSNKWFRANYGGKLRQHIGATCQIRSITDFGELPVFETASTFPMIFVAQKLGVRQFGVRQLAAAVVGRQLAGEPNKIPPLPPPQAEAQEQRQQAAALQTVFTQVKSLEPPYPDVRALIREQGGADSSCGCLQRLKLDPGGHCNKRPAAQDGREWSSAW